MTAVLTPREAERRLYVLTTTRWPPVGFVVGIIILLQTGRGLTVAQAASSFAIGGLVTFALEPADEWFRGCRGRRPVYLTAAVPGSSPPWASRSPSRSGGSWRPRWSPGQPWTWAARGVVRRRRPRHDPGADVDRRLSGGLVLGWGHRRGRTRVRWAHLVGSRANGLRRLGCLRTGCRGVGQRGPDGGAPRCGRSADDRAAPARGGWSPCGRTPCPRHAPRPRSSRRVRLLATNRVLLTLVGVEVFWSVGTITFESLMPLRLEELRRVRGAGWPWSGRCQYLK